MRENTTWSYFLTDNLGSVVGVTDSSGALVSESRYLPFGEVRTDVGAITQTDFGFTFQRSIADTGLMDYRARMYDPTIGRFVQPDTLVPSAGVHRHLTGTPM
jgi:RHS repeat-associated protein